MKIWLYWGLEQNGNDTLLAVYTHQPTFEETYEVSGRNPFFDYELTERETMPGPREHNGALYEKLKKLLPPEPEQKSNGGIVQFRHDHIRSGADSFANCLGGELPRNQRELSDTLWVYGKFMFKEMERMSDYWRDTAAKAWNLTPMTTYIDKTGDTSCLTPKK